VGALNLFIMQTTTGT